jgi:polyprenyl P-hydroxybenzoate/phenylacrylic acid decarboxylase-like protein
MGSAVEPRRLVIAMSGSSAPQLGITLLDTLRTDPLIETHLVVTEAAHRSIVLESDSSVDDVKAMADVVYDASDYSASISSGSFQTVGMAVVPCSMSTLGSIANGVSASLAARAADVTLKERRPLVLVTRETPLNLIHIRNMVAVTEAGATVLPPTPAFYHRPESIQDLLDQTIGKVLDQFAIPHKLFERWTTPEDSRS